MTAPAAINVALLAIAKTGTPRGDPPNHSLVAVEAGDEGIRQESVLAHRHPQKPLLIVKKITVATLVMTGITAKSTAANDPMADMSTKDILTTIIVVAQDTWMMISVLMVVAEAVVDSEPMDEVVGEAVAEAGVVEEEGLPHFQDIDLNDALPQEDITTTTTTDHHHHHPRRQGQKATTQRLNASHPVVTRHPLMPMTRGHPLPEQSAFSAFSASKPRGAVSLAWQRAAQRYWHRAPGVQA